MVLHLWMLAPENELVGKLKDRIKNWDEVLKYREKTAKKSVSTGQNLIKSKVVLSWKEYLQLILLMVKKCQ